MSFSLVFNFFTLCSLLIMSFLIQVTKASTNLDHLMPIDHVAVVFNSTIYTYNELKNIQQQYKERAELAPLVYQKGQSSLEQIAQTLITQEFIRAKLSEVGLDVSDSMVDERIKMITQSQRIQEEDLVRFLASKGLILTEYKFIIKQSLEISNYLQKFLYPLIEVSGSEAKNKYFAGGGKEIKQQDLLFNLVLVTLPNQWQSSGIALKDVIRHLKDFQQNATPLPTALQQMSIQEVNEVEVDDLNKKITTVLKELKIGEFGPLVVVNGKDTLIYLKDKRTKKNEAFDEQVAVIKNQLLYEKSLELFRNSSQDEITGHYFTYVNLSNSLKTLAKNTNAKEEKADEEDDKPGIEFNEIKRKDDSNSTKEPARSSR